MIKSVRIYRSLYKWYPHEICEIMLRYVENKMLPKKMYKFPEVAKFLINNEKGSIVMMVNQYAEGLHPNELSESIVIEKNLKDVIKRLINIRWFYGFDDSSGYISNFNFFKQHEAVVIDKQMLCYTLRDNTNNSTNLILIKICGLNSSQHVKILKYFKFNKVGDKNNETYSRLSYA